VSAPAPAGPSPETKAGAWVTLIGGAILGISGFLPWFTAGVLAATISRNGMQLGQDDGFSIDGLLVILLGAIAILIGISRLSSFATPRWVQRSPIVVGLVAVLIVAFDIPSINNLVNNVRAQSSLATASLGYGVYVAIAGGVIALVGGLMLRSSATQAPALTG
jgi:hypothetical protein